MSNLFKWCAKNPVRTMALITAVLGAVSPFIPVVVTSAIMGIVAALLGVGVHGIVTPVTTMVEKVTESATDAATMTVSKLTDATVGVTGQVTAAAQGIITSTVHDVVGLLDLKGAA